MIIVSAASEDNPQVIAGNVGPILNVLPVLPVDNAEVPDACPPVTSTGGVDVTAVSVGSPPENASGRLPLEVLILRPLIRPLFLQKARNPTQTVFSAGINTLTGLAGLAMTIAPLSSPLPPNLTSLTLVSSAGWGKL